MKRRDIVVAAALIASSKLLLPPLSFADPALPHFQLAHSQSSMDRDLLEVTIPHLRTLYDANKYTVTQVARWYLSRIARYDDVYRAIIHVDSVGALRTAAAQDAARKSNPRAKRGALWGVPILIKANTSVKGLVTSGGYSGFLIPGRELVAPTDATIVTKLKAAGAIILGQTNMPDFAGGDMTISSAYGRTGNAYDPRFSPGGSSGGAVTAVAANFSVFANGTDTGNSIRMPAGTSSLVGLLPTRGLTSIAGILPLDWMYDNVGPIARTVTDVAIALDVMAGEDAADFRTKGSATAAQPGPYTKYLNAGALTGKRFGVPAFIVEPASNAPARERSELQPETRALFMIALEALRAAGATVVFDDSILPDRFAEIINEVNALPYVAEGMEIFLRDFGPARYHSIADYARAIGSPLPAHARGVTEPPQAPGPAQRLVETDPDAEANFWKPQRIALAAYEEPLDRLHLDGYVYPALQMPPNDETIGLADGHRSNGPHSRTGWVNRIGVPAIVVPAGFYANGLPFGIELATKRWRDGDLIGWAFAYEQATKYRKPPTLVDAHERATREQVGTVHFATSCNPAVAPQFDRAVALLHSFEFGASIRGFDQVLARDSTCAMAHWGIALSRWSNPMSIGNRTAATLEPGRQAANAAARVAGNGATSRERAYIAAVGQLYADYEHRDQRTRVVAYEKAMADLARAQPADTEAQIFHAISLVASAPPTDKTYAQQLEAGSILEKIWQKQPNHPGLAHYIIHAYDVPALAGRARSAADRYSHIAPSAAHALHMPSHTFTRLGMWQKSIDTNLRSMAEAKRSGAIGEALHGSDYATYAYLQLRRDAAAKGMVDSLPALVSRFDVNALTGAAPALAGFYAIAAIPARYALERRNWKDAAALSPAATPFPYAEALTYFARALGAAHASDTKNARASVDSLAAIHERLTARGEVYWAEQVAIEQLGAQAWLDLAEHRPKEALEHMQQASVREDATEKSAVTPGPLAPARELLGDMLMELSRPAEALAEYRQTLAKEPNRYRSLYGAMQAARSAGERAAAAQYASQLTAMTGSPPVAPQ